MGRCNITSRPARWASSAVEAERQQLPRGFQILPEVVNDDGRAADLGDFAQSPASHRSALLREAYVRCSPVLSAIGHPGFDLQAARFRLPLEGRKSGGKPCGCHHNFRGHLGLRGREGRRAWNLDPDLHPSGLFHRFLDANSNPAALGIVQMFAGGGEPVTRLEGNDRREEQEREGQAPQRGGLRAYWDSSARSRG
jgi:hypothetical protein